MPNVVLLFPGQGSQAPGMGKDLSQRFPAAREVFEAADVAIDAPLSALCFDGPADELTRTHNAQPALLTHGAAVWAVLREAIGDMVVAAAGHSLGEFTAYHAADALPFAEAVRLVRRRGELMLEAGKRRPGAMAAVLGTLSTPIEEYAVAGLSSALDLAHFADARFPIYANVNAQPVNDAALARRLLLEQLTAPVQWTRAIESIALRHPGALFVEMGPGAVLKGLVKKIVPDAIVLSCGTGADVDALLAVVNA